MAKDFSDFEDEVLDGKYLKENKELFYKLTERICNKVTTPDDAFAFAKQYAEELTMLRLREYHEWLNS